MVRVYYNRRGPLPWSLDFGTQKTEVNVQTIVIEGANGESRCDPTNTDPEKPSAWLEFPDAKVRLGKATALIHT